VEGQRAAVGASLYQGDFGTGSASHIIRCCFVVSSGGLASFRKVELRLRERRSKGTGKSTPVELALVWLTRVLNIYGPLFFLSPFRAADSVAATGIAPKPCSMSGCGRGILLLGRIL